MAQYLPVTPGLMKLGKFFPSSFIWPDGQHLCHDRVLWTGVLPAENKAVVASAIYVVYAIEKFCCFSMKTNGSSNLFPNEKIRLEDRIFFIGSIDFFYPTL